MCKKLIALSFSALFLGPLNGADAYTTMGNVSSYARQGHTITFDCENGKVRLSFLTDDLVRVHMAPSGDFPADDLHLDEFGPYAVVTYTWPGVVCQLSEGLDDDLQKVVYKIEAGKVVVKVEKQPFRLHFYDSSGNVLVQEDKGLGYEGGKVYETMRLPDDEHFFGFGALLHPLDMRGRQVTCSAQEMGGFPVPFFLSTRGYGLFFNNLDDDLTLRMGSTPGEYSFEATSQAMEGWDMDYYLFYGPQFESILKRYVELAGRPMLPEKWYFGFIQNEFSRWDAADVTDVAQRYRQGDWPCDVIIIDHQALGDGFAWDEDFGDHVRMFETVKNLGFKLGLSSSIDRFDLYDWTLYDPTVASDRQDYWRTIAPRNIDGIDFWRQDNSETYHARARSSFSNGYESHNLFGALWAGHVVQEMADIGRHGRSVISRAGPVGGHRFIIPWPGDSEHGLESLAGDLNWIRNGGMSGYPFITLDSGGYKDGDHLEQHNVIRRIINVSLIYPIAKVHGWTRKSGYCGPKMPWCYTPEQQDLMRYYLKLRYRLLPYRYSAAIEAHVTGRPIMAPLVFDYQHDPNTYREDYHFLIGRELLAAPVMERGESREVYLPEGVWINYWTDRRHQGPARVTVDAPLYGRNGLPLFVKSGAIIPMMPEMSYIYEKQPDPITLEIYPDPNRPSAYLMYDCETVDGDIRETTFTCQVTRSSTEISISESQVAYELCVHCDQPPGMVRVDSNPVPRFPDKDAYNNSQTGWFYGPGYFYGSGNIDTLDIKVPKGSSPHLISIIKASPDFNGDGVVNFLDFACLSDTWY